MIDTSLYTLFLVGLFGGIHCAGMCGGIIGAIGLVGAPHAERIPPFPSAASGRPVHRRIPLVALPAGAATARAVSAPFPTAAGLQRPLCRSRSRAMRLLTINLGRIGSYTTLGALTGTMGSAAWLLDAWLPVQQAAFVFANGLLIVIGLYLMGLRQVITTVEAIGAPLWRRLQPHASRLLRQSGTAAELMAGALWGLVPCGMVYMALLTALATAEPLQGATVMLVFGLGTLPNLLLLGWSGQWLARLRHQRRLRFVFGALIVTFGLLGLLRVDAVLALPLISELCIRPA